MSRPFALTIRVSKDQGYDIAEALGFDELTDALSVSVFDDGPERVAVQALYEGEDQAKAARSALPRHLEISIAQLPDEDWVGLSQSGLPSIPAGRFLVHGSHVDPGKAALPILVDAGQAFGTGHHGTTKGCLLMLDQLEANGLAPSTILDLGTGAGILAIAAAKLFPNATILATDIDPVAIDVATLNAQNNQVAYQTVVADGFGAPDLKDRRFDLIIANILAGPLRELAPEIAGAMEAKGTAILSGILDEQADWVSEALRAQGLVVEPQPSQDGWTSLLARRK